MSKVGLFPAVIKTTENLDRDGINNSDFKIQYHFKWIDISDNYKDAELKITFLKTLLDWNVEWRRWHLNKKVTILHFIKDESIHWLNNRSINWYKNIKIVVYPTIRVIDKINKYLFHKS